MSRIFNAVTNRDLWYFLCTLCKYHMSIISYIRDSYCQKCVRGHSIIVVKFVWNKPKEMTKHLNYDDSFKEIQKSTQINIKMMEAIIKNLTGFADDIIKMHNDLAKIYKNLPKIEKKVPIKKHFFKRPKVDLDSLTPEPNLNNIIQSILQYIIAPPKLMEFQKQLRTQFIDKFNGIHDQYKQTADEIAQSNANSTNAVRSAQQQFSKIYDEYNQICAQIETLHAQLQTQETEVLRDQFNACKEQFAVKQTQLFDMLKTLNDENNMYNLSMETNLSKWEESDLNKEHSLQQLFNDFSHVLIQISSGTEEISQTLKNMINSYDFDADHEQYKLQAFSIPQEKRKLIDFSMPPLPFDITEYVSPELVFQDELKEYTDIASQDYKSDICFSANDELVVHSVSQDGKTCIVSKPDTHEVAEIPTSVLYNSHQKERKLMKLVSPYVDGKINLQPGEIVCASGTSQARTICTTLSGQKIELPVSKLTNI